jgi:HEAT repeat protein
MKSRRLALWLFAMVGYGASTLAWSVDQTAPPPRLVTIAADGSISVTASRTPLAAVLAEISVQTRTPILLSDALEDARVSAIVRDLPLEQALKRLLAEYDTFYLVGSRDNKPQSIRAIWIYPKGEGDGLEPVPPSVWSSTNELKGQVDDPDAGVRSEVIETLIERLGDKGLPIVMKGLADSDEIVRLATLAAAADHDIDIPSADLHSLVLTDQSACVRIAALRALEGRPEARAIASSLKDDADEAVRNEARYMLGELQVERRRQPR